MRLSADTLLLLARLGDPEASATVIFLGRNRCAEAHTSGRDHTGIGAGWPGSGHFFNHRHIRSENTYGSQ